ncbi:hypothetical protein FA95DRAFT_1618698 [Auriscalpium vulgare]|uniref:Uncharacterized protein n=1 Tax=Auriscalpium vulgare TaxID=40419 RepID=A0ACB8S7Q5_9AGAM|nr:hypothetical protein FA95DRAFT_1618698 [Auriscalpium vulgare]
MSLHFSPADIYANTIPPSTPTQYQRILEDDDKSKTEYSSRDGSSETEYSKDSCDTDSEKDTLKTEDDSDERQTPPTSESEDDRDLDEAADSDSDSDLGRVVRALVRDGWVAAPLEWEEGSGALAVSLFTYQLWFLGPLGDESEDSDEGDVDEEDRRSDDYDGDTDEA